MGAPFVADIKDLTGVPPPPCCRYRANYMGDPLVADKEDLT